MTREPTVLVTGATGFLGGALACELLQHEPEARLLFLVRAGSAKAGLEKLRRNTARFAPAPQALARLGEDNVLCGDLGHFGSFVCDSRVAAVTHVVNSAAAVSFAWSRHVWITNVEHTRAFADALSHLEHLRRFVHVSTAMVCGATTDRTVFEHEGPGSARQFTLYTKSKAEIERQLADRFGDRLVIARPSIIVGHTHVGCDASPSIFWLFRMIHAARQVPFSPQSRIDVVPVDYCAYALRLLLLKPRLEHACYHVSAGPQGSCSFEEIDRAYSSASEQSSLEPLQRFDIEDLSAMERDFKTWFGICDTKLAAGAIRIYRAFARLNVTFDNTRLLAEGAAQAPRFCDYLPVCVRTAARHSIADQMSRDFR